jgi:hypothetical protein
MAGPETPPGEPAGGEDEDDEELVSAGVGGHRRGR